MVHAIKYHPSLSLLEQHADGTLAADVALAVASHLELCPHCQRLSQDMTVDLATQLAQSQIRLQSDDWHQMIEQIVSQEAEQNTPQRLSETEAQLEINQRRFMVPKALRRLTSGKLKWHRFGGIASAKLPAGSQHHVSLLYISKDTAVPQHTHLGLEMTLVLSGRIVDEKGEYVAGDLLINSPDDTHTPRTMPDEDCLCLSVLSAPLQFKKGLVRLLNPLQQFLY